MSFRENVSKFSISLANHICFRPQHNIAGWTLHRDVGRSAADDRPLDPAVGRVLYMVVEVSCLQHMGPVHQLLPSHLQRRLLCNAPASMKTTAVQRLSKHSSSYARQQDATGGEGGEWGGEGVSRRGAAA